VGARSADRKREVAESEVVDGVAESQIQFAEVAEVLADVHRGILLAAQDHQTLRLIQVHLVGRQSYPGVGEIEQCGSVAERVETVVVVVRQDTQFAWDTEIPAGPTGTWRRMGTKSR
jgi:hypothetical protein